jgi:TetR/AcrR family transcriptional regulator, cholesterol catabolism regulator
MAHAKRQPINSEARERVLNVAEQLFTERGYNAVTLKDIAQALNVKQASLYYHAESKEALYVEVLERNMKRHRQGLEQAINHAGEDVRHKLKAAALWLFSQPMMDYGRMLRSEMPALSKESQLYLTDLTYQSLLVPLETIFIIAQQQREIRSAHHTLLAGSFLSIVESLHLIHNTYVDGYMVRREESIIEMIDILLEGLRIR